MLPTAVAMERQVFGRGVLDATTFKSYAESGSAMQREAARELTQHYRLCLAGGEKPSDYAYLSVLLRMTEGNVASNALSRLVKMGADVHARDAAGRTALHVAAMLGKPELCRELLSMGAAVDATDADGATPLKVVQGYSPESLKTRRVLAEAGAVVMGAPAVQAALLCDEAGLKAAVQSGADLDARDERGRTALHHLALYNAAELCGLLLEAGAQADPVDKLSLTPLHLAAMQDAAAACQVLLAAGARGDARDRNGRTALLLSLGEGAEKAVRVLLQAGAGAREVDVFGTTPLHLATHEEQVAALLAAGADVNVADVDERTPLYYAAAHGRAEICKLLLDAGADELRADAQGRTPLHAAAEGGHRAVCQLLLSREKMSTPDPEDAKGNTPLYLAAARGHNEVCLDLLEAGADPNVPLHVAAAEGQTECCVSLLLYGAKMSRHDRVKEGPPIELAERGGHSKVVRLLRAAAEGKLVQSLSEYVPRAQQVVLLPHLTEALELLHHKESKWLSLTEAVKLLKELEVHYWRYLCGLEKLSDYPYISNFYKLDDSILSDDFMRELLAAGADINALGDSIFMRGQTALMWAVSRDDIDMSRRLLEAGADVNAANLSGSTALHIAVQVCSPEFVRQLLEAGADPNAHPKNGQSPFELCAGNSDRELEMRRVLVAGGAKPEGMSPLVLAASLNDMAACERLLSEGADVNAQGESKGFTALHWAATAGNVELCRLLLKAGADMSIMAQGHTALCRAAQMEQVEVCELLLAEGADTACRLNGREGTVLHHAVSKGNVRVCALLLKYIPVDARDPMGRTPLIWAVMNGSRMVPVCDLLISHGADVNALSNRYIRESALITAAASILDQHHILLRKLIAAGADVNATTEGGDTALHRAAVRSSSLACRLLLHAGVDISLRSGTKVGLSGAVTYYRMAPADRPTRGSTALDLARELERVRKGRGFGEPDCVSTVELLEAAERGERLPLYALSKLDSAALPELADHARRYAEGEESLAAYPYIAELARLRPSLLSIGAVQELVIEGADVNAVDKLGLTALHHAAHSGNSRLILVLLMMGASPEIRTAQGRTAQDEAQEAGYGDIFQRVLSQFEERGERVITSAE